MRRYHANVEVKGGLGGVYSRAEQYPPDVVQSQPKVAMEITETGLVLVPRLVPCSYVVIG